MGRRLLTPEEITKARDQGIPVTSRTQIDTSTDDLFEPGQQAAPQPEKDKTPAPPQETVNAGDSTKLGAAGRSAALSIIPGIAARLGGIATTAAASSLYGAPLGPVGMVVTGLGGGLAAGYAGNKAQEYLMPKILGEKTTAELAQQIQKDREQHPLVQGASGLVSSAVAGGGGLPSFSREALKHAAIPAAAATTAELARQKIQGEELRPIEALAQGIGGAVLNRAPSSIRALERNALAGMQVHPKIIDAISPDTRPTTALSSDQLVKDAVDAGVDEKAIRLKQNEVRQPKPPAAPEPSTTGTVNENNVDDVLDKMNKVTGAPKPAAAAPATATEVQDLLNRMREVTGAKPAQPNSTAPATSTPANVESTVAAPKEVTVPESPVTIDEQMKLLRGGLRAAVLITPGETMPALNPGERVVKTAKGDIIINEHVAGWTGITDKYVNYLANTDQLGELLGYGTPSKPQTPNPVAVTVQKNGNEVQTALADKTTMPEVKAAADQAAAASGGQVSVVEPEAVIEQRLRNEQDLRTQNANQQARQELEVAQRMMDYEKKLQGQPATPEAQPVESAAAAVAPTVAAAVTTPEKPVAVIIDIKPGDQFKTRDGKTVTVASVDPEGNKVKLQGRSTAFSLKNFQKGIDGGMWERVTGQPSVKSEPAPVTEVQPAAKAVVPKEPADPYRKIEGVSMGTTVDYNGYTWKKTATGWKGSNGVVITEPSTEIWKALESLGSNTAKPAVKTEVTPATPKSQTPAPVEKPQPTTPANVASANTTQEGAPIGTVVEYNGRKWTRTQEGWAGVHGVTITPDEFRILWRNLEIAAKEARENSRKSKGIGGGIEKALAKNEKGEGGFLNLPSLNIHDYTEATADRIKKTFGKVGEYFTKGLETASNYKQQMAGPILAKIHSLAFNVPNERAIAIGDWLHDQKITGGNTKLTLPPEDMKIALELKKIADDIGLDKARPDSPWVLEPKSNGQLIARPFRPRPWYWPSVESAEAGNIRSNPSNKNKAQYDQIRQDYIDHYMNTVAGATPEAAVDAFNARSGKSVGPSSPNPEFRGMRFSEGIGIPDSVRERNPFKALSYYVNEHATDMGWHRFIESNPTLGEALNLPDDGRGNAYPTTVNTGKLAGNDIKAALRSYVGSILPGARTQEKLTHAFTSAIVGPLSQSKDILTPLGQFSEIASAPEQASMMKGLVSALIHPTQAKEQAIKSGSARAARNLNLAAGEDALDASSKLADGLSHATGAEQLSTAGRVMLDSMLRIQARNKMAQGDTKFFDKWGPIDWHVAGKYTNDELINHTTANLVKNFAGAYDFTDLPPGLLAGSEAGLFKSLFALQRWSIGRYNRWYRNVWEPAKQGNIKPMIGTLLGSMASAGAINWLTEQVTGRKPKEMKWEEFLNMGGEDAAYTLFSKVATAGYAGIASDLAMSAIQALHKEIPHGFNNMALRAAQDIATRIFQYGNAVSERGFNTDDLVTLVQAMLKDRIQVAKILMQTPDTGAREEHIARRTGYLPEKTFTGGYDDPFSDAARYRNDDVEGLAEGMTKKVMEGEAPAAPPNALRTGVTMKSVQALKDDMAAGQPPTLPYYNYLRRMQGPTTATEAFQRDLTNTVNAKRTFGKAAVGMAQRLRDGRK